MWINIALFLFLGQKAKTSNFADFQLFYDFPGDFAHLFKVLPDFLCEIVSGDIFFLYL
jgi:hypothetical protein